MIAMVMAAALSLAEPSGGGVFVASWHTKRHVYNEVNPGLWLEYGPWSVGAYKNSFSRNTVFATRDFEIADGSLGRLSFDVGVGTGYRSPIIATFQYRAGPVAMFFIPPVARRQGIVGIGFRREF